MKKIKAFFYVAYKSAVSPSYYKEILKTKFEFSLKYYAVLVLIAATISSVGAYFIEAPKIRQTFENALTEAEKIFPEGLVITIKDGGWEVNQPLPLVIPFPGRAETENEDKLPQNLIIFDKTGVVDDLETKSTAFLVNEKNLLIRQAGANPAVYPLQDLPNVEINKQKFLGAIQDVRKFSAVLIPLILIIPVFSGLMVYYAVFRGVYLVLVGGILYGLSKILKNDASYKDTFRIGLHAMTLPVIIDTVLSLTNYATMVAYWFIVLNIIMGVLVIRAFKGTDMAAQPKK